MHDSHKIRTLLACIDDLTKAVKEMSAEANIHQADQDLLLYRSRLFYEAVLCMPTAAAVAPELAANVPVGTQEIESEPAASAVSGLEKQAVAQTTTNAVEQAITLSHEVESELTLEELTPQEVLPEAETAAATIEASVHVESTFIEVAEEPVEEMAAATEVAPAAEKIAESPLVEEEQAAEPAISTTPAEASVAPAAKRTSKTVAFSLTGIIERTGDSHLVMAHLKLKPIDDLKSGIGLNEKFLFIRELFGNDHMAYADAIEKLNAAPSLDAAEQILATEVLPNQEWDLDTEAALSFLHLIFRRFAQA